MKKFTEWVGLIREAEQKELSMLQKSYQEYFTAKLKKYGVESPADLSPEKKAEFFSEITKDWEKGKGANESGKKDVKEYGVSEGNAFLAARARAIEEGSETFKFSCRTCMKKNCNRLIRSLLNTRKCLENTNHFLLFPHNKIC
jgi:hypothetical protein